MNELSVMIKPVSVKCNMVCDYCFYNDTSINRSTQDFGTMSETVVDAIVSKAFLSKPKQITFIFQGGEPLLIGLDFFEFFVETVNKYNLNRIQVHYSIQTNGSLLKENIVKFFKEHNFLVGISLDGNDTVHNHHRISKNGSDSFDSVINGMNLLKEFNVDFNILSVVTNEFLKDVESNYKYLSKNTNYLQFIPCINPIKDDDEYLNENKYEEFLIKLFDVWETDFYSGRRISIRYFDDLLKILLGINPDSCTLMGQCSLHFVVEANGDVFPCDFYVLDEYRVGNILESNYFEMINMEIAKGFIRDSIQTSYNCKTCKYYVLCRGGCKRNNGTYSSVNSDKTRFCISYYNFFESRLNRLIKIAKMLKKEYKL